MSRPARLALLGMGASAMMVLAGPARAAAPDNALSNVAAILQDGYDIKAAFYDNSGGAYIILQKGTSAYMCHSNPAHCEKLN